MCLGAWNSIAPYVTTLLCDGNFPWEKEKGVATISCPDPEGISLELRRVDYRRVVTGRHHAHKLSRKRLHSNPVWVRIAPFRGCSPKGA